MYGYFITNTGTIPVFAINSRSSVWMCLCLHSVLYELQKHTYLMFLKYLGGFSAKIWMTCNLIKHCWIDQWCHTEVKHSPPTLYFVCVRYPYKRGSDIIHVELFSTISLLYLRSILGCSQDFLSQVSVNQAGTHAIAFCPSPRTGITDIVTWNLETEDHKHITRFPAVVTRGLYL